MAKSVTKKRKAIPGGVAMKAMKAPKAKGAARKPLVAMKAMKALKAKGATRKPLCAGFPAATPEEVDMLPGPLEQVRQGTKLEVRKLGSIAGVAHIVLRRGRCVLALADGWANKEKGVKFSLDTICRMHGSTKALVGAAFATLLDDGLVRLDDEVEKYIPFADRVALAGGRTRPVRSKATLRHLLTMTAGLGYTDDEGYRSVIEDVRKGRIADLKSFCEALASAPLQSEPGKRYEYSFCTDVLGRVCEVVSGRGLDAFVKESLLKPLGMEDTGFSVPPGKRCRVAELYKCEPLASGAGFRARRWDHPDSAPGIPSSGGGVLSYKDPGIWSTARDYAKFCQMLLDGGRARGGRRVLSEKAVKWLWTDSLAPLADSRGSKDYPFGRVANWHVDERKEGPPFEGAHWDMCGWSPLQALLQLKGAPRRSARQGHSLGLGGGGGTYWLVDRERQLAALSFTQSFDGGRGEDDGLGPPGGDCVDLAVDAAKAGDDLARKRKRRR